MLKFAVNIYLTGKCVHQDAIFIMALGITPFRNRLQTI